MLAFTIIESVVVAVAAGEAESVTVTLKLTVPAVVGVPVITPVALSVNPAGSALPVASAHVYGALPPLATRVWL